MDTEHECKLEAYLSTQLYEWCISEEDADSTSKDWLLLEASETLEKSQTTSPDSCTLLPTASSSVDLSTLRNQLHPTIDNYLTAHKLQQISQLVWLAATYVGIVM